MPPPPALNEVCIRGTRAYDEAGLAKMNPILRQTYTAFLHKLHKALIVPDQFPEGARYSGRVILTSHDLNPHIVACMVIVPLK